MIHHDYAKEQRWANLGADRQGPVRAMAQIYAMALIGQAEFMARLLRDGLTTDLSP